MSPPLVIGIGNLDRGDDGIGRRVARRLRELAPPGTHILEVDGEPARLVDRLDGRCAVWLIDAAASAARPGTIRRFDATRAPLPAPSGSPSSHGLGAAEAIELARALGQLPEHCIVFTIEGGTFEVGGSRTPAVEAAAETLAHRLAAELAAWRAGGPPGENALAR